MKELLRQAELKFQDENARKKRTDDRAYQIIGVSIALILYTFKKCFDKSMKFEINVLCAITIIVFILILCIVFSQILAVKNYPTLGMNPSFVIDKINLIKDKSTISSKKNLCIFFIVALKTYQQTLPVLSKLNDCKVKKLDLILKGISIYFTATLVILAFYMYKLYL